MARETLNQRRGRLAEITALLRRYYPDARCALDHADAGQLLIATVLSAQCTDARVNLVTPELFRRYPAMKALAEAPLADIERSIASINFFRNKAKALKGLARELTDHFGGRVPGDLEALVRLPGVGRKTANVVLGNAFGQTTGIVVDTHVHRLSRRLGLTRGKTPAEVERDLMKLLPREDWIMLAHWLIFHGRQVCKARNPACETCFLADICPQLMG